MEKIKIKNKKKPDGFKAIKIVMSVIFGIYAATLVFPIVWGIIVSVTSKDFFLVNGFMKLPTSLDFSNYAKAFSSLEVDGNSFGSMLFNSIWFAVGGSVICVFASCITAYACARYDFMGGKVLYWVAIVSMMIPITNNLPSVFKFVGRTGLYGTPFVMITQLSALGFNFLVMYSFFKNISAEYGEAAYIDGAGHWYVFSKVYLPMAISSMIALWLTMFIGFWSDAMYPLMFMPDFPTLASGLHSYQLTISRVPGSTPILYAGLFISAVPILVLFLIFRDKFMDLQISGGIKG